MIVAQSIDSVKKVRNRKWIVKDISQLGETGMYHELTESKGIDAAPLAAFVGHLADIQKKGEKVNMDDLEELWISRDSEVIFCSKYSLVDAGNSVEFDWKDIDKKILGAFLRYFSRVCTKKAERYEWCVKYWGYRDNRYGEVKQGNKKMIPEPLAVLTEHLNDVLGGNVIATEELYELIVIKDKEIHFWPQPPIFGQYYKIPWKKIDTKYVDDYMHSCKPKWLMINPTLQEKPKRKWRVQYLPEMMPSRYSEIIERSPEGHSPQLAALLGHLARLEDAGDSINMNELRLLLIIENECIIFHPQDKQKESYRLEWADMNQKVIDRYMAYHNQHATEKIIRLKWKVDCYGYEDKMLCRTVQTKKTDMPGPLAALIYHLATVPQRGGARVTVQELRELIIYKDRMILYFPQAPYELEIAVFKWRNIDPKFVDAYMEACDAEWLPVADDILRDIEDFDDEEE